MVLNLGEVRGERGKVAGGISLFGGLNSAAELNSDLNALKVIVMFYVDSLLINLHCRRLSNLSRIFVCQYLRI